MRITVVYGASTREVHLDRVMDGRRNRLVISCGWPQRPAEVLAAIADQLTPEEIGQVAEALGVEAGERR
jgi:hypothetical protein